LVSSFQEIALSLSRNWPRPSFVHRPRAERRESPSLVAVHWEGQTPRQSHVANISSSGAYLLTEKRWASGEVISLTLQRAGELERDPQRCFTVQARSVRCDDSGVGVTFLLPPGADLRLWQSSIKSDVPQTEPEDVIREFRLAAAMAVIHRISPVAVPAAGVLCREGLSNYRLESAIEIVLHAEELLALECNEASLQVHPAVLLRILDDGSWAETVWIQHYWAAVLATSCVPGDPDTSPMKFVNLLNRLTTIQARIFTGSCTRASKTLDRNGTVAAEPLSCSAQELIQIADTHDRIHIERDIHHLVDLGLIEKSVKWRFFLAIEEALITPTALALELFARCHGFRGEVLEFYEASMVAYTGSAAD
jgi:hypothetical protein